MTGQRNFKKPHFSINFDRPVTAHYGVLATVRTPIEGPVQLVSKMGGGDISYGMFPGNICIWKDHLVWQGSKLLRT